MTIAFRRFGGSTHVRIDSFAQLVEASGIPETQYVALSAPTSTLLVDPAFLAALDTDGNGRVRVEELRAAVAFTAARLRVFDGVDRGSDVLTLAHLADDAHALRAAAKTVLGAVHGARGGDDKATNDARISLADVRTADAVLRAQGKNGDGIVAPAHLPEAVRALGASIAACFPPTTNRAGEAGLAPATLATFRAERTSLLAHLAARDAAFVWGEGSLARAERIASLRGVVDEYFLLCRLVASQPGAAERLRLTDARLDALVGDRAALDAALAALPLCPPDPAGVLHFDQLHRGPHHEALAAFAADVVGPVCGDAKALTEVQWRALGATADAVLAWQKTLLAHPLAPMRDTLHDTSSGVDDVALEALAHAQQADLAEQPALDALAELQKLVLFQQHLLAFANSFVAMPHLYSDHRALFERGFAVFAGRRYELGVHVPDVDAHKAHTESGTTCVIYARIEDKDGNVVGHVALPKTRGWSTELQAGRRGLFYDVDHREFDAVIVHIVRQPVSIIEAALTPFLRIGEFLQKKAAGLNQGVDGAVEKKTLALDLRVNAAADAAKTAASAASPAAPPAASSAPTTTAPATTTTTTTAPAAAPGAMGNALAMGGLAVAAVGSSVAFIAAQLKALTVVDVLSIVAVAFFAIALPSGFVGWLRLRKRDLATLLEGSGWALNDRLRLTPALAARITTKPPRPAGSTLQVMAEPRTSTDDEPSHRALWTLLVVVFVVAIALWQLRGPLLRAACAERRVPAAVCAAADVPLGVDEEPSP
jgi:hypothetical protein